MRTLLTKAEYTRVKWDLVLTDLQGICSWLRVSRNTCQPVSETHFNWQSTWLSAQLWQYCYTWCQAAQVALP